MNAPDLPARKRAPSRAVAVGTIAGGSITTVAVWILSLFGIPVPAEVAGPLGSILAGIVGYFMNGGRQT